MKKGIFLFVLIIEISITAMGGNVDSDLETEVGQWTKNGSGIRFLENKGQMTDMQGKAVNSLLFKTSASGVDMYVTTSGLSYVFTYFQKYEKQVAPFVSSYGTDDDDSLVEEYCRADMDLLGADIRKENIVKEDESQDRTDYYLGDICPNGILNIHNYGKITIKNIYPGIDWILHSRSKGLKYDFIVHPGADPSVIRLKYKWTDKPVLMHDGSLEISTPMGDITEGTPMCYMTETHNRIQTTYKIENNEVRFKISEYDTNKMLTIDPTLVWATYYAGSGSGEIEDVTGMQDDGQSVWVTGYESGTNFPTQNPGGNTYFQGTQSGTGNAFIMQFDTSGALKWATYYGGSGFDASESIYSDGTNVWVTGFTQSTNFPTLSVTGAYNQSAPGGSHSNNAFILQFNTSGVRQWATYYGGNGFDEGYSIQSDGTNVWVTGSTTSSNFPLLNPGGGAYYQSALGKVNAQNAFLLQFTTSGVLKWATYYGGYGGTGSVQGDRGSSIQSDGTNVWVTGFASSSNFPLQNLAGAYNQSTIGSSNGNAFILQFSTSGVLKWATYFGGSGSSIGGGDNGTSIFSDGTNVWVTGSTTSTNFPIQSLAGAYNQSALGSLYGNAFISHFNTSGALIWSTYYGGTGTTGYAGSGGYSIQSQGNSVWVCGATGSKDFPTYDLGCGNFYQDTLGNQHNAQDIFILQFNTSGVREWATYYGLDNENDGSYISSDGTNLFVAGDAEFNGYPAVNPGYGAYSDNSLAGQENVIMGKFCIACGRLSIASTSPAFTICRGDTTTLSASGGDTYSWSPSIGLDASNIANPIASPTITTTYTVTAITNGCISKDSAMVTVNECDSIYVPNVFTPNGDGKNDFFLVTIEGTKEYNIDIYNRWGDKIFESTTPENPWDGRSSSGVMQADGVYYYMITGTYSDEKAFGKKGFLQLVK